MPRALLYIRRATITGPTLATINGSDQPQFQTSFLIEAVVAPGWIKNNVYLAVFDVKNQLFHALGK